MPTDSAILAPLTDDFLARLRRGEQPDIDEYARAHPDLANRIRQLFPTLLLLEGLAAAPPDRTADHLPVEPDADISGRTFGPYRLVREIGRGGMGVVYEAEHEALHRRVALKLLSVAGANAGQRLERFFREAQIAAGLHHTNIVPVFDVGQIGGRPYYAMQYITGRSLEMTKTSPPGPLSLHPDLSVRRERGRKDTLPPPLPPGAGSSGSRERGPGGEVDFLPLSTLERGPGGEVFPRLAHLGRQAALALAYAHARGVIHRDIKPANLILDDQGTLWITDFGLARRLDDATLTADGQLLGTPRYMSPEQAEATTNPIDHRTDIYSLGVTLYELLVGRPAHDGQTPPEVLKQILHDSPPPPRQLAPNVPRDLETVVLKAMARRPADRYQTAQELADDLGRFAANEPVRARRIGVLGRTWRWAKREPKVAGLIAAVVLTLTAGVVGTGWFAALAKQRADESSAHAAETVDVLSNTTLTIGRHKIYGEPWQAVLWYCERLKSSTNSDTILDEVRRTMTIVMRYTYSPLASGVESHDDELLAAPLMSNLDDVRSEVDSTTQVRNIEGDYAIRTFELSQRHFVKLFVDEDGIDGPFLCVYSSRLEPKLPVSPTLFFERSIEEGYPYWESVRFHLDPSESIILLTTNNVRAKWESRIDIACRWSFQPLSLSKDNLIRLAQLLACHRLDRGRYVPLSHDEARAGWQTLKSQYPDVFTVPTDDLLAWHLKEDDASVSQKHRHAALIAANFDCRDRPTEPHPFVARGRLCTVLGKFDQASADFATAWKLGGTGWVKSECRRLVRDANNTVHDTIKKQPAVESAYRKLQIAATYLEQDPKTMASLLVGTPPAHRIALATAKLRLGLPLEKNDTDALAALIRLPGW